MMNHFFTKEKLISLIIFLVCLKIMDISLGLFGSNDPPDYRITSDKMLRDHIKEELQKSGTDYDLQKKEMYDLYYNNFSYHPYRWYSLPENFQGINIQTDSFGFRNNNKKTGENKYTIGLFGGSTMFGIYKSQENTIPSILEKSLADSIRCINFGIGAYSSTTELMTLLEVIRHTKLDEVIFYDGVNELVMFLDGLHTDDFDSNTYRYMGHYYSHTKFAIRNSFNLYERFDKKDKLFYKFTFSILPNVTKRMYYIFSKNNTQSNITKEKKLAFANQITDIYLYNIQQIKQLCKANHIKAHFIWQPNIINTQKQLSNEEQGIKNLQKNKTLQKLANAVQEEINPQLTNYGIHNFSNIFDQIKDQSIFLDWCHINDRGNEILVKSIQEMME